MLFGTIGYKELMVHLQRCCIILLLTFHIKGRWNHVWNAPFSIDDETLDSVIIPVTVSPNDMAQLQREVNPHTETDDYGISQYLHTVHFIQSI